MLPSLPNPFVSGARFVDVSEQFLPAFMMITLRGLRYLVSIPPHPPSCEIWPVKFLWKVSLRMSPFLRPLHLSTEAYVMLSELSMLEKVESTVSWWLLTEIKKCKPALLLKLFPVGFYVNDACISAWLCMTSVGKSGFVVFDLWMRQIQVF